MADPPHRRSLLIPIVMIALGVASFVAIAADVLFHGMLAQADLPIARFIYLRVGGFDTLLFSAISGMGDIRIILPGSVVVGLVLMKLRHWRTLLAWAAGMVGCGVINPALKAIFAVPRPEQYTLFDFRNYGGYSFPSGHTMAVAVFAGLLAMVYFHLQPVSRGRRILGLSFALGLALLESFALTFTSVFIISPICWGRLWRFRWPGWEL